MNAFAALVQLDIRGILRDDVMLINVGMSVVTIVVITTLGAFQQHLPGWADWFPFMVAYTFGGRRWVCFYVWSSHGRRKRYRGA